MNLDDLSRRMHGAVTSLRGELAGLRTGRASANLLDPIVVDAYGASMPIGQLASVSVPEPRMIAVQVWDRATVSAVDRAIREVKSCGKHVEASICYTVSPVHNLDRFVTMARQLEDLGTDTLCIKDMAGLLAPLEAYHLVRRLKSAVKVPIHLHTHYTSGMASMSSLMAILGGLDMLDTAVSPLAGGTSHPPTETVVAITSSSRGSGCGWSSFASAIRRLVSPAIAEGTTTRSWPAAFHFATRRATLRMRSIEPTEVPPNFWMISAMKSRGFYRQSGYDHAMARLRHIALTVPDPEKAAKFYMEAFGLRRVEPRRQRVRGGSGGEVRVLGLQIGNLQILGRELIAHLDAPQPGGDESHQQRQRDRGCQPAGT